LPQLLPQELPTSIMNQETPVLQLPSSNSSSTTSQIPIVIPPETSIDKEIIIHRMLLKQDLIKAFSEKEKST